MRFLIDNSLSPQMVVGLQRATHDAIHVRDLGLAQADDVTIFELAGREGRVIVAQDTDFGTILAIRAERQPSVILFRCQAKSTEALLKLLLANLPAVVTDLEAGAIVVIEDTRVRIRLLPIAASGQVSANEQ